MKYLHEYILSTLKKIKRFLDRNTLFKPKLVTKITTRSDSKLLPDPTNDYEQTDSLVFRHFWPKYTALNSEKYNLLNFTDKSDIKQRVNHTVKVMNKNFPSIFLKRNFISTLPLPLVKNYTDSKKKANEYFRTKLKQAFPNTFLLLIGVAELYQCNLPCHWINHRINPDKLSSNNHDSWLCSQQQRCLDIHQECQQGWHFPFWHIEQLNFDSWVYGKVHTREIDNDHLYTELSYFLKNYIEIKLNPELFKSRKLNLKGLYYHKFNEAEDLAKRAKKAQENKRYYSKKNSQSLSYDSVLIFFAEEDVIELKRNSLVKKRSRLEQKLKKINWINLAKRNELKLKLKAFNFILKSNLTYQKLTSDQEWIWNILSKQQKSKNYGN